MDHPRVSFFAPTYPAATAGMAGGAASLRLAPLEMRR